MKASGRNQNLTGMMNSNVEYQICKSIFGALYSNIRNSDFDILRFAFQKK